MDQQDRILDKLESIETQLRSIRESASNNTISYEKRLTGLDAWTDSHEKQDELRYAAITGTLEQLQETLAELKGGQETLAKSLGEESVKLRVSIMEEVKALNAQTHGRVRGVGERLDKVDERVKVVEEVHIQTTGARKLVQVFAWAAGLLLILDKAVHLAAEHLK